MNVDDIKEIFRDEYRKENFTVDKTGAKTIEIIGASFIADKDRIFREPNREYIKAELEWYSSQSLNVNDIPYGVKVPDAWVYTANKHGQINSNYGYLIFSKENGEQYKNVLTELRKNKDTRRAVMIYNRPSMHVEYKTDGKNDFICTNSVSYYIRDDKLSCVVQMRSNDAVFGYLNDFAWQEFVLNKLCEELEVTPGEIHWQVQNLHVYERHFNLI